jgi:hypothetical protein
MPVRSPPGSPPSSPSAVRQSSTDRMLLLPPPAGSPFSGRSPSPLPDGPRGSATPVSTSSSSSQSSASSTPVPEHSTSTTDPIAHHPHTRSKSGIVHPCEL